MKEMIVYKPTCSKCGAIIKEDVYGVRTPQFFTNKYVETIGCGIHPSKCQNCGAYFYGIIKNVEDIKIFYEKGRED